MLHVSESPGSKVGDQFCAYCLGIDYLNHAVSDPNTAMATGHTQLALLPPDLL